MSLSRAVLFAGSHAVGVGGILMDVFPVSVSGFFTFRLLLKESISIFFFHIWPGKIPGGIKQSHRRHRAETAMITNSLMGLK